MEPNRSDGVRNPPANQMGANYGYAGLSSDDEDDNPATIEKDSMWDRDKCCRRVGWKLFFRAMMCPCAKSRPLKGVKNPSELKTITLHVPVPSRLKFNRPDNTVTTSKYTPYDFLFKATALQFRRAVNIYYLFQVVLLLIAYVHPTWYESPFTPYGTLGVLTFVIGVTLIFEGTDDLARHRSDAKTNGCPILYIDFETRKQVKTNWGSLVPGDVVIMKSMDLVPADVLVLQTGHASGTLLYVETSGIDGETNLKIKRVAPELKTYLDKTQGRMTGQLRCEEPNPFLNFSGQFAPSDGAHPIPLQYENLVLRGSQIRNTPFVLGMVVYAGVETKLMLSKRATPSKFAAMDLLTNKLIMLTILQQWLMTALSVILLFTATQNTATLWYFKHTDSLNAFVLPGWLAYILTFTLIFAAVVPINLYVDVEIAGAMQSYFLIRDLQMYDEVTDTPAGTKTSNLISEIGQVSHVFSDKTGTLTQNVMRLVGVSVEGKRYGVRVPDAQRDGTVPMDAPDTALGKRNIDMRDVFADLLRRLDSSQVSEFLLILALCHTVVIDTDEQGQPRYNAEGPDEEALVKAAAALGFTLESTDGGLYIVRDPAGVKHEYTVLAINAFNSDRKRMSVVCRKKGSLDGLLLLKGADSVVAERAVSVSEQLQNDLDAFAQSGLRTLLVAKRSIPDDELTRWQADFMHARATAGTGRDAALAQVAEVLEQRLEVVGATAIEDALQEGVPETIQMLRDANIRVWVLTGDKVDTAINIGFSSRLLEPEMHQILLDDKDTASLCTHIDEYLTVLQRVAKEENPTADVHAEEWEGKTLALVVTGKSVECLLTKQKGTAASQRKFITLASLCAVVLACRVSPAQKALLVRAAADGIKSKRGGVPPVTLAIGDGANDVAMIQEARVGVGISGKEGLQAANSADFSIAQFRFLARLLFVHGRWSYLRQANLILYVTFSWEVLNWGIFFYCFQCMFSGEQAYVQTFYITLYAWLTNYIVIAIAWFNRDLSPATVMECPRAYDFGRLNYSLTWNNMVFGMVGRSLVYAALMYGFVSAAFPIEGDLNLFGSSMYMCLVILMTLRQGLISQTLTWVIFGGFIFFFLFYPLAISILDIVEYSSNLMFTLDWPSAYLSTFMAAGTALALEYLMTAVKQLRSPNDPVHVLMEYDRGYSEKSKVPRPTLHGLGDVRAAFKEGNTEVFLLPAKKVAAALAGLGGGRRKKSGTTAGQQPTDEVALRFYKSSGENGGGQFGTHRSAYDFSAPET